MGNTPGKEERPSYQSHDRTRRNTTSSVFPKKLKRSEEKDRQKIDHYMKLVVKFDQSVDGGYLAPFGTYKSNLDFNVDLVRELIISRRLAPFYTPLQDFDENWSDEELIIIVKQLTLHLIEGAYEEEEDDIDDHKIHRSLNFYKRQEAKMKFKKLVEDVKQMQKNEEDRYLTVKAEDPNNANLPSDDLILRLYRDAVECPICFVFHPNNLNLSRCCLQPICTECFVQIKRLDPHPPHDDPSEGADELPHTIISEPANCPYCAMSNFGVIFDKTLDFSTGIGAMNPQDYKRPEPDDLAISSHSSEDHMVTERKRRASVPANSSRVITTDYIRPDWESKLSSARSKLARKAAAASAIHASNLIINPDTEMPEYDTGRRRRNTVGASYDNGYHEQARTVEDRMIEQALRLSILDEEERRRKELAKQQQSL